MPKGPYNLAYKENEDEDDEIDEEIDEDDKSEGFEAKKLRLKMERDLIIKMEKEKRHQQFLENKALKDQQMELIKLERDKKPIEDDNELKKLKAEKFKQLLIKIKAEQKQFHLRSADRAEKRMKKEVQKIEEKLDKKKQDERTNRKERVD